MLAKRNDEFKRVFDRSSDFNYKLVPLSDGSYQFDYVTESFSKITGIATAEVSKVGLEQIVHEDDIEKVMHHFSVVLKGKPNTEQFRLKSKTGEYVEVIDYAKPDWDADETSVKAIKGATSTEVSSERKS